MGHGWLCVCAGPGPGRLLLVAKAQGASTTHDTDEPHLSACLDLGQVALQDRDRLSLGALFDFRALGVAPAGGPTRACGGSSWITRAVQGRCEAAVGRACLGA